MLGRFVESFFSKIGEQLVDHVQNTVRSRETLDSLRRNLESLSARAYDIEEQIKNAELSGKKKRKREVEKWLTDVRSIETELENEVELEGFISRFMGGGQAAKLNERVDKLVEQSRHFGELLLDVHETRGEALLTTGLVGKAFEINFERIWRLLVTDKVSSIGIYGMGGVGKTTLAKHINNRFMENTQECVIWVTVSQVFTIKMLQDEIARVVGVDLSDENNEDKRAARLHRALSQRKNSVLILDDVWENIDLKKVGDPLSVDGCRLVVTSRSLEVCRQIGCREVIAVETLRMDEAWNLFSETLGEETKLAPQVRKIAMSVAKVCNGLPLGIITMAGSMRGETDIRVWRNALTELQKSVMENDEMEGQVFKVLKYSFDRLDPNHRRQGKALQLCFLYCSLYPEDMRIKRDELIRKFISEELVDKRKSIDAQLNEGHSILNRLVNVSLLESASAYKEGNCVKMHDLVRAMALKITEDKTMVIAGQMSLKKIPNEEEWTMDLEKISLMDNEIGEIPLGMSPNCPKLSTLLLQHNPLELIPESFFSKMCGLCTLDLSGTLIRELPNSLSELESLKALLLGECRMLEYVPYLGKLTALKELDLSKTAIREVPEGMEKLVNLKYLLMYGAAYLQMLPTGLLLNLPCLQLLCLPYEMQAQLEGFERLKQLERVEGRVQDMSDFNRFIESRPGKQPIVSYCIVVGEFDENLFDARFPTYERINKVIVYGYDFKNREEKDVIMLAEDIRHLEFLACKGLSNCLWDDLSNPKSLVKLKISHCSGIECILRYEQFMAPQELESGFQALEEIRLWWLDDFMGVIHKREIGAAVVASPAPPPPQVVFSSLTRLSIAACNKMKKLGLPISVFKKLESIDIGDCLEIEEIIEVEAGDDEEGRSSGEGEARRHFVSLPKLRELRLNMLPRLKSITCKEATMICSSIEKIYLVGCPTLKKLGLAVSEFPNLEEIEVLGCRQIEEIIQVEVDDEEEGRSSGEGQEARRRFVTLPKLKKLALQGLPRLERICKATMICSSIETITLVACPTLKKLPFDAPPPALEHIILSKKENTPVFSSLRQLTIKYCGKMKKLGLAVSEFPNLEEIDVRGCYRMEEIIQVEADGKEEGRSSGEGREARRRFVTLPKLKKLALQDLPRLERICKATMICSSIETITLVRCPKLKKLPFHAPPPALKQIFLSLGYQGKKWWESLEWEHPTHSHLFQPLVRFEY